MSNLSLREDEAFVEGRSYEQAIEFLARAEKAGLDPHVVRTTSFGYIVPKSLLKGDDPVNDDENPQDTENPETGAELNGPGKGGEEKDGDSPFDPADHTVKQVEAYLDGADDAERDRVLAAEREGQNRKAFQDAASEEND